MTTAENMSLPLHEDASSVGATPIILKHRFTMYRYHKMKKEYIPSTNKIIVFVYCVSFGFYLTKDEGGILRLKTIKCKSVALLMKRTV